jgi:hypothetical protein
MVLDMGRPDALVSPAGGASEQRFGPGYCEGVREWLVRQFSPLGNATGGPPEPDTAAS